MTMMMTTRTKTSPRPRRAEVLLLAAALLLVGSAARAQDGGIPHPTKPEVTKPTAGTITVPASVVKQAMNNGDIGAVSVKGPDGQPLGAKLSNVAKYKCGLKDGDVVTHVAGTRTPTVDAVVGAGMRASMNGATQISGKILRGTSSYNVVLELPK